MGSSGKPRGNPRKPATARQAVRALAATGAGVDPPLRSPAGATALRLVTDASGIGVLLVDSAGTILDTNRSASRIWGHDRTRLLGAPMHRLVPRRHRKDLDRLLKGYLRDATRARKGGVDEAVGRTSDGREVPIEISGVRTRTPQGAATALLVRDIRVRKQAEAASRAAIESLKRMSGAKTDFINLVAHELRTPLAPIKAELSLLKSAPRAALGRDERDSVASLSRNFDRLAKLVEDLLSIARYQAGRLTIEPETIDLSELATRTAALFSRTARLAHVRMRVDAPPRARAVADPIRLEQVVYNLISNAIKFSPKGSRITVQVIPGTRQHTVRISDTGLGFDPKASHRLFQPFSQIHQDRPISSRGAGLGLYISRALVELQGGRIRGMSPGPGRGATFEFTVPVDGVASAKALTAEPEPTGEEGARFARRVPRVPHPSR